jgi:hypothetical protein
VCFLLYIWIIHSFVHFVLQLKLRGITEEGGRIAVSGENGWAFFDFHLAMFGPQELPAGPFRLQMALPPFGCDPAAYTVRIVGAVVSTVVLIL